MKKITLYVLGMVISMHTFSQNVSEKDSVLHVTFDEVVISANKWEQNIKEIPLHIAIIKNDKIEFQNPQTGADLLSTSGQVYVQKSQMGGGSPMIRGFATNRILLVVDGVRLNNAIFRSGNLQNSILMDANNIEASEVIFGPGSVVYGSDAIGGVMDFHTLSPKFRTSKKLLVKGSALARWSSANMEKTGHVHFNIGTKKFASLTSFSYSDYGDLHMGSNGPDNYLRTFYSERINGKDSMLLNSDTEEQKGTAYKQYNLLQKFRYKVNQNLELNYAFHLTESSNIPRYDRLIKLDKDLPKFSEWYYGPQKWMMNSLQAHYSNPNALFDYLNLTMAHQNYKESRHDRGFRKKDLRHKREEVQAITANLDFTKAIKEKGQLYYGFDLVFNTVNSTAEKENIFIGNTESTSTRYPDGSTWNSYALYVTYKHHISNKLTAHGGVRYNFINMQSDFDNASYTFPFEKAEAKNGALTGSLGLVYNPGKQWFVNANFGTGFRSPNVDDMSKIFDSGLGFVVVPNPDLKPEYAYNYELGVTKIIQEVFKVNVGAFYTILDDALVRRDYTFNGRDSITYNDFKSRVQALQNASTANVYGFFAGLEMNLRNGFGMNFNYNYQKGEEELDNGIVSPSRHAAPWFGNFHLTYTKKAFKLDLYTNAMGEVSYENLPEEERKKVHLYASNSEGLPYCKAWCTLNFKANYKIKDRLVLMSGVENITDVRYRPYSSGIVAAGRNFIVAVKMNF